MSPLVQNKENLILENASLVEDNGIKKTSA